MEDYTTNGLMEWINDSKVSKGNVTYINVTYYNGDLFSPLYVDVHMKHIDMIYEMYLPPVLLILGSISNLITFIILNRKVFEALSSAFYLMCFCISNLLTLYLFLATQWITFITQSKPLERQTDWLCPVWQFILRVVSFSGIWYIVAATIDRYIIIWHPWRVGFMCTKFVAKFVAIIIVVGLVVISVHAMWTFQLMENGCYTFNRVNDIHAIMWPWMSASFYSFIPLALLFVFFVLILTGICLKRPYKHKNQSQSQNHLTFTYVTLGISMTYFVLALIPTVTNIVEITYPPSWLPNEDLMLQMKYAKLAGLFMGWLNTISILPICLVLSKTFRKELLDVTRPFLCWRHKGRIYELQAGSQSSATQVDLDLPLQTTDV